MAAGRWRGRYTSLTVGNTIRWCVRRCWRVCLVTHWVALSITIDVGRYWNLPYFYIPGHFNVNSVLFETAVCMTIYIGVMALEFAPALFERLGLEGVATAI